MNEKPKDLQIIERRRGRPRVEAPLTSLSIRLPVSAYDRLTRLATASDKSVSSLARQLLILRLP